MLREVWGAVVEQALQFVVLKRYVCAGVSAGYCLPSAAAAIFAIYGPRGMVVVGEAAGEDTEACKGGIEEASDAGDSEDTELAMADGSIDSGTGPKERHECSVCGITTTSAAHLEVGFVHG